jgi:hypothetical protein
MTNSLPTANSRFSPLFALKDTCTCLTMIEGHQAIATQGFVAAYLETVLVGIVLFKDKCLC